MGKGYFGGKMTKAGIDISAGKIDFWDPDNQPLLVGGLPSFTVRSIVKELSTAQVLALSATPIEVVAAPGASKVLICHGAFAFLDYNSTAYVDDAGEDLVLQYKTGVACTGVLDGDLFLDNAADIVGWMAPVSGVALVNKAIEAKILTGEIITGNSPIFIRTYYSVIPSTLT